MRIIQLCCIALFCMLSLGVMSAAPRQTATTQETCPEEGCHTYLPIAKYDVLARLLYPASSESITTLAPIMLWSPIMLGEHRVQVSTDSTFSTEALMIVDTEHNVSKISATPAFTRISSNLQPGTAYFWRVGSFTARGWVYGEPQAFFTPAADAGTLPPAVTVLSPRTNSVLKRNSRSVVIKWQPVSGALLYRIRMEDNTGKSFKNGTAYINGTDTSFTVDGLQAKNQYTWKIRAYNSFGWGPYTEELVFITK